MRGLDVELAFAEGGLDLLTKHEDRDCAARPRVVTKRLPPARLAIEHGAVSSQRSPPVSPQVLSVN